MMQTFVHRNTHPRVLTEALDEADDTSPAPFSWHFHGVNSHTEGQGYSG